MLNNGQNNSKETMSINTKSIQLMNRDGFMPSTLVLGYWNDLLSIKIHPPLEKSKQTDTRYYNYEEKINTALTVDKAQVLVTQIERLLMPAIRNDEEKNVAVIVSKDSLVLIGTGKKLTGSIKPYIALFKGLDPATKRTDNYLCYEFKSTKFVLDYDYETGECETTDDNISEFLLFYTLLKSYVSAQSNSIVQTIRYVDRFYNDKLVNNIHSIMSKLGIQIDYPSKGRRTSKPDVFGAISSGNTTPSIPVEEVDDLEAYIT
jgi:hypothetical protein